MFFLQQTSSPLFVSSSSYQSACLLLREFLLLVLDPESSNDKRKSQYWRGKDTRVSNILAKYTQHTVEYFTCKHTGVLEYRGCKQTMFVNREASFEL